MLKKILRRTLYALLSVILLLAVAIYFLFFLPFWGIPFNGQRHGRVPLTPAWALECWLWEDDINTAERVDELLAGYAEHDIPVRTIIIDSPWSTRLNDFEVDTMRYPQPRQRRARRTRPVETQPARAGDHPQVLVAAYRIGPLYVQPCGAMPQWR